MQTFAQFLEQIEGIAGEPIPTHGEARNSYFNAKIKLLKAEINQLMRRRSVLQQQIESLIAQRDEDPDQMPLFQ